VLESVSKLTTASDNGLTSRCHSATDYRRGLYGIHDVLNSKCRRGTPINAAVTPPHAATQGSKWLSDWHRAQQGGCYMLLACRLHGATGVQPATRPAGCRIARHNANHMILFQIGTWANKGHLRPPRQLPSGSITTNQMSAQRCCCVNADVTGAKLSGH